MSHPPDPKRPRVEEPETKTVTKDKVDGAEQQGGAAAADMLARSRAVGGAINGGSEWEKRLPSLLLCCCGGSLSHRISHPFMHMHMRPPAPVCHTIAYSRRVRILCRSS